MKQAGFTLIEMLVGLVLIGLITTLAAPAFGEIINSQRRQDAAQQLASGIRTARTEAVLRSQPVVIRAIEGNWSNGWQIVIDPQKNQDDLIVLERARSAKVPIIGNRPVKQSIRFNGLGTPSDNGFTAGTLFVCDAKSAISHHRVILASSGRVRIESDQLEAKLCG